MRRVLFDTYLSLLYHSWWLYIYFFHVVEIILFRLWTSVMLGLNTLLHFMPRLQTMFLRVIMISFCRILLLVSVSQRLCRENSSQILWRWLRWGRHFTPCRTGSFYRVTHSDSAVTTSKCRNFTLCRPGTWCACFCNGDDKRKADLLETLVYPEEITHPCCGSEVV